MQDKPLGSRPGASQCNPIIVDGIMYATSANQSVYALEAATGQHIWHFQTVHHDMWDYDLPAPPALVTINQNGKKIDAVAQITKQGFVFVFNRETGESLFPIEERKVPASNLPNAPRQLAEYIMKSNPIRKDFKPMLRENPGFQAALIPV